MSAPPSRPPRVVIPDHTWRNTLLAVAIGLVLLTFVGFGLLHMARPVQGNKLAGEVVEKIFIPQAERQVSFSGRKIEGVREIAGEYVLKVSVGPEKRIYEVPVEQYVFEGKKVGDALTFIRPPSEQK